MEYFAILRNTMEHIYKKSKFAPVWFDDVECILFDGNTLVLNTKSETRRSLLKGSAGQHLKEALKELHQLDVTIIIIDGQPIIDTSHIKIRLSADKIIHAVCEYFDITKETLFDPDAKAPANLAHRTAMFFLKQCQYSKEEIAQYFSRDTSTIDYGVHSISCGIRAGDEDIVEMVDTIRIKLEQLSSEEIS